MIYHKEIELDAFFFTNCRAAHNLYQLVKRHQKQAADVEETPEQLHQVYMQGFFSSFQGHLSFLLNWYPQQVQHMIVFTVYLT